MNEDEIEAAVDAHMQRLDRASKGTCTYGNCVEYRDADTGEYLAGWGPMDCPCQFEEGGWAED